MAEQFANVDEMDVEDFELYVSQQHRRRRKPRSRTPETRIKTVSPRQIEVDDLEKRLEAAKRAAEDAQRDDCTVLVLRLHIKADERDVYEFFNRAGVGKVRDVRLIRDPKTSISKGVAYVEFYTPDAVLKSMALSGQLINGVAIQVQPSQAEKNRHAAAERAAKAAEQQFSLPLEGPNKIYVAGLKDAVGARELRHLFSSFGEIEHLDVQKGVGYIQYRRPRDAREAVSKMDHVEVKGRRLRVGMADSKASIREAQSMGDHEEDGKYLKSRASQVHLRNQLARDTTLGGALPPGAASSLPTLCLLLSNLWAHEAVDLTRDPEFFVNISDDVQEECRRYGRVERVKIETSSSAGNVWVKFADVHTAKRVQEVLNDRYFNKRQISAVFVTENMMLAHTSN
jgi:RNA-binding protein 39